MRKLLIMALSCSILSGQAIAQQSAPSFTARQAQDGQSTYARYCAACHGLALSDGIFAPPLKGRAFLQRWGGKSLDVLFVKIVTTMPTAAPRSLGNKTYAEILAYLLQHNGVRPGSEPLPVTPKDLGAFILPTMGDSPTGGLVRGIPLPPAPNPAANPLDEITPVTDAMLASPPEGDWLTWRRDNAANGFSPLQQIDRENVRDLRVAWSWALPEGPSQVVPLVHDGVIFVHGFNDEVQALDAKSGELLWSYMRWIAEDSGIFYPGKRSMAIYGKRLYVPTTDAYVVALDVTTGAVVWEHKVADVKDGYRVSGGPLIARGKVMVGTAGRALGGNYIVGLDVETGQEAWRVNTIARPGEAGGNSWAGVPFEDRHGASVWVPGSYDPETGLAFFGTGQTYDTGPLLDAVGRAGVSNSALYTDTTLAIDPDSGELIWYYQHLPNDQWDLDWAFERHVVRLDIDGQVKTVIATGGKIAIFDLMDAATGRYVKSIDLGLQNIVTAIDPVSGAKRIEADRLPSREHAISSICPHADGAKNWIPSAYNPGSTTLYVPIMEICMDMIPVEGGEPAGFSSGVRWEGRPRPDSDGNYGRLQAVNLQTGETEWMHRQRAPRTSGLLATAGGLLFGGDLNRFFAAYDQSTGEELWRVRLNDVSNSAPITYLAGGKQYLAVTVGQGRLSIARSALVPEIRLPAMPSATIWVFEIPDDLPDKD